MKPHQISSKQKRIVIRINHTTVITVTRNIRVLRHWGNLALDLELLRISCKVLPQVKVSLSWAILLSLSNPRTSHFNRKVRNWLLWPTSSQTSCIILRMPQRRYMSKVYQLIAPNVKLLISLDLFLVLNNYDLFLVRLKMVKKFIFVSLTLKI